MISYNNERMYEGELPAYNGMSKYLPAEFPVKRISSRQELHHEIFGSILDRTEMTPFLLLPAGNYETALRQATKMMGNRGFDTLGNDELRKGESERAQKYIEQVHKYFFDWMFPFVKDQLEGLAALRSRQRRSLPSLPADHRRSRIGFKEHGVSAYRQ